MSRKKKHLKDVTVTEINKEGVEVTWKRINGHWVETEPEACQECNAPKPHHEHECRFCPLISRDGKMFSKTVQCKHCRELAGFHRGHCNNPAYIESLQPFPAPVKEAPKKMTYVPPKVTQTTGATSSKTPVKTCWHDGDDIVWKYKDTTFTIADISGCDAWHSDIVLDLNGNLKGETSAFITSGPSRFTSLNQYMHPAEVVQLKWPDYDVVPAPLEFWQKMLEVLTEKQQVVMITCHGGHGRSGTCLAALMIASGIRASQAILKVRTDHCAKAIESRSQEKYLWSLSDEMLGITEDQPVDPREAPANKLFEYCIWCGRDFAEPSMISDVCVDCVGKIQDDTWENPSEDFTDANNAILASMIMGAAEL